MGEIFSRDFYLFYNSIIVCKAETPLGEEGSVEVGRCSATRTYAMLSDLTFLKTSKSKMHLEMIFSYFLQLASDAGAQWLKT